MIRHARQDSLIAQHIEVALVYKEMLGADEAKAYLERENIPRDIVQRTLFTEARRRPPTAAPLPTEMQSPPMQCRRKNHVHDAIVEAALKIERKFGAEHALALLKHEAVPQAVASRILADGPRQIRVRRSAD